MPASTSTADQDAIKTLIQWTTNSDLSTGDLDYFLDNSANINLAAANAARSEAVALARKADKAVGDLKITYGNAAEELRAMSKSLRVAGVRTVKPYSGGISISDKTSQRTDSDWDQSNVRLGIHDNPSGGSSST